MSGQKKKYMEKYQPAKFPEFSFLDMLAHEVENFRPGFSSRYRSIKKTFILSTTASSFFGVEVSGETAYIGVPKIFFTPLYASRIDSVCAIKGQAGIFIILTMGPIQTVAAIRIFCSKKRAEMVSKCKNAWVMAIDSDGESLPDSDRNQFEVGVITKSGLDWE